MRKLNLLIACAAVAAACGEPPTTSGAAPVPTVPARSSTRTDTSTVPVPTVTTSSCPPVNDCENGGTVGSGGAVNCCPPK